MKTDFLKGLGLSDDVIAKIQAESGKDVEAEKISIHTLRVESDCNLVFLSKVSSKFQSTLSVWRVTIPPN